MFPFFFFTLQEDWINKVGVEPNIKVALDEEYAKNPTDDNDNQLQMAIKELIK